MRAVFLLILLTGVGIGFIYPWAITNFSGHEIGTWRVYDAAAHSSLSPRLAQRMNLSGCWWT